MLIPIQDWKITEQKHVLPLHALTDTKNPTNLFAEAVTPLQKLCLSRAHSPQDPTFYHMDG